MAEPERVRERSARVAFARVNRPPKMPEHVGLSRGLLEAITTGTMVTRHRRDWRMGRFTVDEKAGVLYGRIGYEGADQTELWDEPSGDFRAAGAYLGKTSPFALNLSTGRVAFQLRGGLIRRGSFVGALQALLNEASTWQGWRVDPLFEPATLESWAGSVDRVSAVRFTLHRPNPNYDGRPFVKQMVENTNAALVKVAYEAAQGESIDLNDNRIAQEIDHVAKGYGQVTAQGERSGRQVPFNSKRAGAAEERKVAADPGTGEATRESLRREVT